MGSYGVGALGSTPLKVPLKDVAVEIMEQEPQDPDERKEYIRERTYFCRDIANVLRKAGGFSIKRSHGIRYVKVGKKKLDVFFERYLPPPITMGTIGPRRYPEKANPPTVADIERRLAT